MSRRTRQGPDRPIDDGSVMTAPAATMVRRFIGEMWEQRRPELADEVLHVVAEGDRVAVLFECAGTHRGVFGGIEPTGRAVRFWEAGFFRVLDGMVIEGDFVADRLGVRIQLGVLPEDFGTNSHR